MLVRRVIVKHTIKPKCHNLVPAFHVASGVISYGNCHGPPKLFQRLDSQLYIRTLSTSSNDNFEIDFVTMKKKPKKLSESDKQQYVSIHKLELPKVDFDNIHFKHSALDEWLFQLFKENQFSASEDSLSNNRLKENLGIIHEIYSELREFEIFVQFKCNKKHFKFSELSTSDILKYLEEFKEVHNGSSQSYHKMYDELSRLLKSDSEFSQTLSCELIPAIQLFEKLFTYYYSGLFVFEQELRTLDKQYDFKKFRSTKDLTHQIEKTLTNFDYSLLHDVDANHTFFKMFIQCSRYSELNKILKTISNINLRDIKNILKDPQYNDYFEAAVQNCIKMEDKDFEMVDQWNEGGGLYYFLTLMKMIPATHDYYKLAPLLFALSKDKGIFASAAGELLRILTNEEVRGPINVASMVDDKQKFPIYAITKNNFTNYVFSFLKLIDFPWESARDTENWDTENLGIENNVFGKGTMYDYLTTNQYFIRRIFSDPNITIKYMELRAKPSFFCLPKDHEISKDVAELKKLRESLQTSFASFKTIDRLLESISKLGTLGTDKNLILSHLLDASRYFGNNTFVLDDVIDEEVKNDQPVAKHDSYSQMPDWLHLESHVPEINFLKLKVGNFSDKNAVMTVIENLTNEIIAEENAYPEINANSFLKLRSKLIEFSINNVNDCLEVLDTVVVNQDAFEKFEQKLGDKKIPAVYIQIPDDFPLHEFVEELSELREVLGKPFSETNVDEILNQVQKFLEKQDLIAIDKTVIWRKLYRNLAMLFKHNNNNTFVLDNVISSAQEFKKFETNHLKTDQNQTAIGSQGQLLVGTAYEVLGEFLRDSGILYKPDVHNISASEFDKLIDQYADKLDKSSSTYLFRKNILDQLKQWNSQIEFYPPFLVCIYGTNYTDELPFASTQLEMFYDDLVKSLKDVAEEQKAAEAENIVAPVDTKLAIDQFKKDVKDKVKYNDSGKLFADLDKKNSAADFEAIKLAVHSAFEEPHEHVVITTNEEVAKHKKELNRVSGELPLKTEPHTVDTSKLEKYLQEAKKLEESKKREKEAFEWSKQTKAPSRAYSFVRSILATSGLVLLSLIGIDFYMKETDKSSSKTITDYQNEENNKLSRTSTTTGPFTVSTISGRTPDVPVIFGKEKIKLVFNWDSTENGSVNDDDNKQLSWWQKLFWKK